jgi:F-type H+-transporting ATPase subunit delta
MPEDYLGKVKVPAAPGQMTAQIRPPSVLEDPGAQAIARIYAKAFLDAAVKANVADALEEFQSFLDDVLAKFPEFNAALTSGILGRDEKLALIDRVVAPRGSALFTNFLRVLARHERLDLVPVILNETRTIHEKRSGRQRVQVTSARPLADAARQRIIDRLRQVFQFEPILEEQVDAALLGGVVIRVGDTVYDSSLRTRMKQLRGRLRERSLYEIQSGRDRFSH